jgi:hydroxymethylpyrimidine/phosphomethylpyrimidine kinase
VRYSHAMASPPIVLSIAGYDPSSGAGITADIKTAAAHHCYAVTCMTALTVQSTQGVFGVQSVDADLVGRTLETLVRDLDIAAARLGMLGSGEVAGVVADFLSSAGLPNVVLDPVIRSSSGAALLDDAGLEVVRTRLLPLCDVATPNIHEAAMLVGVEPPADESHWTSAIPKIEDLAAALHQLGAKSVIVTGGHLRPPNDYLSYAGGREAAVIVGEHIESASTHGTGCAYATALACELALGRELPEAAREAKQYVQRAIAFAYPIGKGTGPINHLG